ncbi:DNA-entry nuclease [Lacticaseibacillus pantheris DSM 15945 = JCM 12539 = NBRC 106106]|uniref:DNA-entry nuclease n=2 Tax=Lacticaseibacillus pantheris TaxID=171523 RepID=A0A0R1U0N3_9LACO|nr:DNA-entry nuclease [Lacticaseibacillus pantheris DSM 15945 = JCM 12539 = NBRC 106106]
MAQRGHWVRRTVLGILAGLAIATGLATGSTQLDMVGQAAGVTTTQRVQAKSRTHVTKKQRHQRKVTSANLAQQQYSGTQTVDVNGGHPTFTKSELSTARGSWQYYGALDSLNRATDAEAMLNQSLMPTAKREELTVNPTGWHNKRLRSGYLYNRSHLIGYQLTGQNNNWRNLITGTRSLNSPEMLHYEDDIADYLHQSDQHYVRYAVVPVFKGDNLLASGVQMMAQSVGDNAVAFNVYIFNVEDGVTLNYADGTSAVAASQTAASSSSRGSAPTATNSDQGDNRTVYVTPTGKKYHFDPNCRGLRTAKSVETMTLSQAEADGYTLCAWEQ